MSAPDTMGTYYPDHIVQAAKSYMVDGYSSLKIAEKLPVDFPGVPLPDDRTIRNWRAEWPELPTIMANRVEEAELMAARRMDTIVDKAMDVAETSPPSLVAAFTAWGISRSKIEERRRGGRPSPTPVVINLILPQGTVPVAQLAEVIEGESREL